MLQSPVVVPPPVVEVVVGGVGDGVGEGVGDGVGDGDGVGEGVGGLQVTKELQVCVHLQQNVLEVRLKLNEIHTIPIALCIDHSDNRCSIHLAPPRFLCNTAVVVHLPRSSHKRPDTEPRYECCTYSKNFHF